MMKGNDLKNGVDLMKLNNEINLITRQQTD